MTYSAKQRFIPISPRKVRRVINVIRGESVLSAYRMLRVMPHPCAKIVLNKLIEAVNNASQKDGISPELLFVSSVFADEGPVYKRFKPRAQGRIYKRLKKTTHISIHVSKYQAAKAS